MARKAQRLGNNSVTKQVEQFAAVSREDIPVPQGLELRSPEEQGIWSAFTRARAREDWRDLDLILLHKMVRIEADLRRFQASLDTAGPVLENARGTPVENPLFRVIDTLQRQQLAIIRSMSLNNTGSDPRTINAQAKGEAAARKTIKEQGVESLLAMPGEMQ